MNRNSHKGVGGRVSKGLICRLISRMKYSFCFFLFILCGETWAQLTCTYCEYWDGGRRSMSSTQSSPRTLLGGPGTYGDFRGVTPIAQGSVYAINGTGYYTINTSIGRFIGDTRYGFTLSAPSAGGWGGQNAGLILTGRDADGRMTYPNFYMGETVINGGFIACNKPRDNLRGGWTLDKMKAIVGDIKLKTTTPGLESGLWFGADGQLGGDGVVVRNDGVLRFETANANAIVSLNGTTQRLAGIEASNSNAIFENIEPNNPTNIPGIPQNRSRAVLILTGRSGRYVISGARLRAGGGAGYNGGLEVRVEGNSQVIQDPGSNIEDVTFTTTTGESRLELNTSSQQVFAIGGSVVFTGETGTYLKSGPGEIRPDNFIPNAANIQVDGGTFTLVGNSKLGGNSYSGSVSIAAGAVLEHNNSVRINFNGPITGAGTLRRTGEGVTLISGGRKDLTGDVRVTGNGCFFGGYSDISDAAFSVSSNAKIGGGEGQDDVGGTLTVGDLTFESQASKLVVTSQSWNDGTPSLVVVESRGTNNAGNLTLREGNFTVDLVGGNNLSSGYVLKCANGVRGGFPLPAVGANNTGRNDVFFRWDAVGLYMSIGGDLTCDNCTFNGITGTIARPAVILASPGRFTGNITLNGACNFSITGPGNYTLSGAINGTGPLTYNAPNAGQEGHGAGITLEGGNVNIYSGLTILKSGYIICNKMDGKAAVPGDIKVSAPPSASVQLWCRTNNQLGGGVLDFRDAQSYSYFHLNGTTQTVAGLQANNDKAVVENNWDDGFLPAGMTPAQRSGQAATLNIATGFTTYTFGGGGYIRKGTDVSPALTVNVTGGSQVIENPGFNITNVTLASSQRATLELRSSDGNTHAVGSNVTFGGSGILKKTGTPLITTNRSNILKTGGKIWVTEGVFRNEHYSNRYANGDSTQINKSALQVDANAAFDMWANVSIFDGLTGGGTIQNNWGPPPDVNPFPLPGGGYCWLTLGQNNSQGNPVFDGVIKDNPDNGPVSGNGPGAGGIALKKVGSGTQVLKGGNLYTGRTKVSSGTLRLEGNGVLGATGTGDGSYGGVLDISNTLATQAIFEHNGSKTQTFTAGGNITNSGTGTLSTYLQSGSGKTIIEGVKSFAGNVRITGGYLGGSGDLSQVNRVTVEEGGSVGGGNGETAGGATLTVSNLTFVGAAPKLRVTSRADNTPSLVDVKASGTSTPRPISVINGFTVEVNGTAIVSGYVLKCSNGLTGNLPLPTVVNNTGKPVCFKWDATGLYMTVDSAVVFNQPANLTANSGQAQEAIAFTSTGTGSTAPTGYQWKGTGDVVGLTDYTTDWTKMVIPAFTVATSSSTLSRTIEVTAINSTTGCTAVKTFTYTVSSAGLTCDNCTFNGITGTIASPAVILASPGTFTGNITLNGACNFSITGPGNYTLSGVISGTGPLTYNAPNAGRQGHDAGITLEGDNANTYSGLTTIKSGYIICNKTDGKAAVPGDSKVSAASGGVWAHLWCRTNGQLGSGGVLDFRDAQSYSYIHLNGTTQTVAGLQANNDKAVVENNWDDGFLPAGMTAAQRSTQAATLNIAAGATTYTFAGGGYIRKGTDVSPALTVNVTGGSQVIQNPSSNITNVTLTSSQGATLEFSTSDNNSYSLGEGVTFRGEGTLKKTGAGVVMTNNSTILKSGLIVVSEGLLRNDMDNNVYSNGNGTNTATLQIEAPSVANNNPTFDLWGNVSIFDGLTGEGIVQNGWGSTQGSPPGEGYSWLTLGQNNSQGNPVFEGVIKDNPTNGAVSANGRGAGGIALKKVGSGTQVLRGGNIYTGRTRVSSGSLRLEGNGVLGATGAGGSYGGVLEIANVPSETATVFEHNGSKTQTFTAGGNITNSGTGTLGTYLQSGSGKTIIEGVKSFAGNVRITGGFLGGSGDLSQANTVVGEGGSIGGGNGETGGGAVLTVSNLTFAAGASKLRVTSRGDNTPSLVDVKANGTTTPGPISAANGFTVEVNDAAIVSGYVLKCSNGLTGNLPLPTVVNNTGKSVCFKWDGTGLWMQIGFGNITLTSTSLCLAINPVNLVVTVTASYSDPRDYPPLGAAIDFSLSDPSVKSGEMTITRVQGSTVIATFNGKNQTTSNKSYTVTYDDHQNCAAVTLDATINPQPVLRVSSGSNPTCKGTPVELQATGTGLLTISSANINAAAVVSITSSVGLATAGSTPLGNAVFFATDANGCRSENLSVLVKELPVLDAIPNQSVCSGASVDPYIPPSSGVGESKPTSYQWEMKTNAVNRYNVGLSNYTADWTKPAINHFIVENTTDDILKRDVTVSAYNSATGCTSAPRVYTITVNPSPVITTSGIDVSKLCSGVIYSNVLSGEGSWSVYKRGTTETGLSTVSDGTSGSDLQAGRVTEVTQEDIVLTSPATSCKSSALSITIHPSPVITTSGIDVSKLCSGVIYSNALSGEGSWSVYKRGTTETGLSTVSEGTLGSDLQAGTVTAVTQEDVVLTSVATSCKSSALSITIHPSPVITTSGIDAGKLCSGVIYSNALSGEGSWSVYKRGTTETGLSTVTDGTSGSDLQAGIVTTVTQEDIVLTSVAASCKSSALSITINPSPVITTSGIDAGKLCSGVIYSNALSGEGSWSVYKRGTTETGLSTVTDGTSGSDLQAGTVTVVTVEDVVLTSVATSCKSSALSITIHPSPVITTSGIDVSKLCSGVSYSNALSGAGSWSVYKRGTTEAGLSTVSDGTSGSTLQAGIVTTVTQEDIVLTSTAASCKSSALTITIHPSPVITTSGIDVSKLCSGVIYSNALSGEGSWSVYKRGSTEAGLSTVSDGTSGSTLQAGIVTEITQEEIVLTSVAASCKSSALSITIHPSPVITTSGIDAGKLCSGVIYSNALSGEGSWSVYKRGTTETGLSTVSDGTSGSDLQAGIVTVVTQEDIVLTSPATSCKSSVLTITVNPSPVITTSGIDAGKLCSGVIYSNALSGEGSWSVYKRGTTETGLSTVSDGTSGSTLQAGTVTVVTVEDVVLTSPATSCKSSALTITIHPSPVITTSGIDVSKLCSGVIYSNALSGEGSWSVYKRGTTEAGLSTVSDGTSGSDLQAGTVTAVTVEDVVLTSVATSCKSSALTITVNPSPVITTSGIDAGKLCSGVIYSNALSGEGSWSVYKRGTTEAGLSTVSEGTSGSDLQAGIVTVVTVEDLVLTSVATSCKSSALTITIHPSPVITTSGIDVSKLCSGVIYSNALSGEGSWSVYRRGTTEAGLSTVSDGTSGSDLQAGIVTEITQEEIVLTSVATSCKSSALTITIHPSPVITTSGIDVSKLCSGVIYSNALSGEGSWSVYKRGSTEAGLSTVSDGTSGSTLQAGIVTEITQEEIVLTSVAASCKSSALSITIHPSPVITTSGIDAGKLCSGVIYSNALSGEGSWSVYKRGTTETGLSTVSDGTSGSDLQAGRVTEITQEEIVLTSTATSCKSSALTITIHPSPVITTSGIDAGKLCSGVSYSNALSGEGSWSVYKRGTTETGLSTVSEGTSGSDLQAGTVTTATQEDVVLTSVAASCKSSALSITIHPSPVITTSGIDAGKLCSGVSYSNALSGEGSWSVYKRGTTETGLSTVSEGTSGSDLQAGTVTTATQEDVVLTSVAASCKSSALTITIHPSPVITTTGIDVSKLCSGVSYSNALSGEGSWSVYQRGTTEAGLSTVSEGTSGSDLQAGTVLTVKQEEIVLTSTATSCKSSALTITVNPSPVIATSGIDVAKLCSGVIYSNALSGEGSWSVYKRGTTETGLSTVSEGTSGSDLQAGTVTTATQEDVVLTSVAASCKSSALSITIHPSPVITTSGIDAGKLCSGVSYSNALSGEGSWSVYKRGTTETGLSTVSEGTSGSDLQAGTVTTVTQEDIVLTSTATSCKSSALSITIHPSPVITTTGIDAGKLCSGVSYSNALSGAGSWSVYKRGTTEAGLSTVSDGTSGSDLQAGRVTEVTQEDIVLTSTAASCKSSALTITINPSPVITTSGIDAGKLCSGVSYSNALSGAGSWSVYKHGTTEAGLSTVSDGTSGSDLQAGTVTAVTQEDVVLTSVAASCKSSALTITIHPSPVITTSGIDVSKLCSGVIYSNALSGAGSWSVYKRGTTEAGLSTVSDGTSGSTLQAGIVTEITQEEIVLTSVATSCKSSALTIIIHPSPVITTSGIDVSKLCSGVSYSNALSGAGSWSVYKRGTTETGLSTVSDGTSGSDLQAGTVTAVTVEDVVLTSTATSCKSSALTITVNPSPVITTSGIDAAKLCSGVIYSNVLSGEGSWSVYKRGTTETGLSTVTDGTSGSDLQAGIVTAVTVEDLVLTSTATSCKSSALTITVNPSPVITTSGIDVSKLCSGVIYSNALSGEGSWSVYKRGTTETGLSTVTDGTSGSDLQAGTVLTVTQEEIVLTSTATSCKSSALSITIYPKPVMNPISNLTTCGNSQVPAYTPASPAGVPEEARTTHYKWKAEAANPTAVGLSDYTADWTQTAISQFTAANLVNTIALKRDITVYAYNSTSGCQAEPQVYTITVNPGPVVTYSATSPICNGIETDVVLRSTLSPTTYTWTVGNNRVGARSQTTASGTSFIRQTLTNRGSSAETVTYKVTGTFGHCSDTVSIAVKVSNADPATPTVSGGGHYCVNIENSTWQTDLKPSVEGKNVEWTYTSYYGNDQAVGSLSGNTQKAERGSLTAVKDNLVLSNTSSASVYYVFRPYSAGCFGTPSDPIGVRLYAAPVLAAIPPREVCSSSEAYPTTANIALSSSTPDVVYTWIVDRINGRDITGYSEPLRNGARVPTQNPSQARSGLISDALSLPANATAQTLDYWITPWLFGCPGQAVLGRVKVNPLPTVTAPADREHCLGNADLRVAAEPLKGTAESFIWTGGIKAGLADHTVYGSGLPAYKVAASTTSVAVKVTITGKNDKGCKASTFFRIAVNPKPSITLGNSQILCTGPTIETAAQTNIKVSSPIAGTKYKWTATFIDFRPDGKSDVKLVSGNNELLALPVRESPREGGNFIRKITATTGSYAQVTFRLTPFLGGCAGEGKDTDVIVKGVNLAGGVSNNSPDVCSGGTTNIKIGKEGDGNTYSWEGINTSNNVLGYTPSKESGPTTISDILTIINTKRDSTVYHITPRRRFINADGKEYYCDGKSVSTTVFVNPIPVLSLSPDTASVCSGESVVITPSLNLEAPESNEVYYSWEVTPNGVGARSSSGFQKNIPQQVLTNDNASESSVTYTVTPQYKPAAGGTCKGLPATSTYQVSSRARTSISKIPESVCLGDKVTLKTDSKGTHYQWLKNGKTIPEASGDSYVVPTDSVSVSSYAVRVTSTGCGSGTSEARKVQVSAEAYFTGGNATMDKAVAAMGEAVKFSYSGPKAEYLWDFNDNTSMLNVESVSHSYSKAGTYYPTLKATKSGQAACTKTFSFSLEIRSAKSTITAMYGVFPIPARDKLTISSNEDDLQHIALSDMSGKMVLNEGVKGRNVTLSVAHLAQGIYLLTITNTAGEVKRLEIAKE